MLDALTILKALLQLALWFSRRAERADVEQGVLNALELANKKHVDAADSARDDVMFGRVPADTDDPYRRD